MTLNELIEKLIAIRDANAAGEFPVNVLRHGHDPRPFAVTEVYADGFEDEPLQAYLVIDEPKEEEL